MSGLVLASGSASRRAMLDAAGVPYRARPAQVDERAVEAALADAVPAAVALALAEAKARDVHADHWTLGSDSLVAVEGRRFDKPASREQAGEHLAFFSGKVMHLHSAAAIVGPDGEEWRHAALAELHVRDLSPRFIDTYLDAEWPAISQCAGAFRIEALGVQLFERIEGDHFTVLGMPLLPVLGALRQFGVIAS